MKKLIIHCSFFIIHCSLHAVCPSGYGEVDAGAIYAFDANKCPSGYGEIDNSLVLPSPTTGSDAKGSFTYGACSYQ